ncbi:MULTISPECIES: flagellar export chaperone FlgN [unclassified Desulfovibrio]|uniref:flagellar export chaperone FlgN n=1 Tax=unclassified Desulfovibrio TaxID=2593640 RepID=UPI000F5F7D51|nr:MULTISPECIES: flagellar export chaperone FlgN [unclassified Desulfovibrio]RRD70626.1 flagellar protein FlgN [Desulfovibrio sp. OH1209_COT-279]RRD87055.1 flagellar protein FlgN [Desulfovibrio sp. OH1186_COT-070]
MYTLIHASLARQEKALGLLRDLLEEEYRALLARGTDTVVALEFSVQELVRQLAVEKDMVIRFLGGTRVADYADMLEEERAEPLRDLLAAVDAGEQGAARQAARNSQLSLALLDQSSRTLQALTSKAVPPAADVYGRRGGMRTRVRPDAALISGRL